MGDMDAAELGRCFDAHVAALVLYARQWVEGGWAEDVVQDVFLRLMGQAGWPGDVKGWLFRSVRNAAISAARSGRRRERREREVAGGRGQWFESRPGDKVDAQQAQAAMMELDEREREVVVLRIWAGMTLAEVSAVTGLAVSTVHDLYRGAIGRIRSRMEASCRMKNH